MEKREFTHEEKVVLTVIGLKCKKEFFQKHVVGMLGLTLERATEILKKFIFEGFVTEEDLHYKITEKSKKLSEDWFMEDVDEVADWSELYHDTDS